MFDFSTATQLFQGSIQKTWSCVTQISNLLWHKLSSVQNRNMPRSRRRHHSRSRSKSRSHSYERDREIKRRKVDTIESSVSSEEESDNIMIEDNNPEKTNVEKKKQSLETTSTKKKIRNISDFIKMNVVKNKKNKNDSKTSEDNDCDSKDNLDELNLNESELYSTDKNCKSDDISKSDNNQSEIILNEITPTKEIKKVDNNENESDCVNEKEITEINNFDIKTIVEKTKINRITPKRVLSPKQIEKNLESEKKRAQKQREKEEREKKRLEEKKERERKKNQEKEERLKKIKEKKEQQLKEKQEKEQKRKEKEEKEEIKRQEKLKKQYEIEEKNKEKQKAAAAFVNFFRKSGTFDDKKSFDNDNNESIQEKSIFMPFEIKSIMRLPPIRRNPLSDDEKDNLIKFLSDPLDKSTYINEIKQGKIRRSLKTWPYDEDTNEEDDDDNVILIEDNHLLGESICEDKEKPQKMRAKFLKFSENRRPPYYGTWRKKSKFIKGKNPFIKDDKLFDYDIDSDDDWEEEEQGESIKGSDEENDDIENDDYEVDNKFFVPHGHLSEDEMDNDNDNDLSMIDSEEKLKLLQDEFDENMKHKTHKLKPHLIGCIWYDKENMNNNISSSIDKLLKSFATITDEPIIIKKRNCITETLKVKN